MQQTLAQKIAQSLMEAIAAIAAVIAAMFGVALKLGERAFMLGPKALGAILNSPGSSAPAQVSQRSAQVAKNNMMVAQKIAEAERHINQRQQHLAPLDAQEHHGPQPKRAPRPDASPHIVDLAERRRADTARHFDDVETKAAFILHTAKAVRRGQPLPIGMCKLDIKTRLWLERCVFPDQQATEYLADMPSDVLVRHLTSAYTTPRLPAWPDDRLVAEVEYGNDHARELSANISRDHAEQVVQEQAQEVGEEDVATRTCK